MREIVIVNCFETYNERVESIYAYFRKNGCRVTVVQSDFMHQNKKFVNEDKEDYIFIKSKSYNKNISIQRILSHIKFASDAFDLISNLEKVPEIVYVVLPPNSLAKEAINFKKRNLKVKVIFDIMDLWPEAFTRGNKKLDMILNSWKKLRSSNLSDADLVITECNFFQKALSKELFNVKTDTLFLTKANSNTEIKPDLSKDNFEILYLGSINTIIDIEIIVNFLLKLNKKKKVIFHIIGDGENREKLIAELVKYKIKYIYHGVIFDQLKKQEIINHCHFGMNIMRENIAVGLTMKSIDYFQFGLPIINNIKEDTEDIVNKNSIGFNITKENIDYIVNKIYDLSIDEIIGMKYSAQLVFEELFSKKAFTNKLNEILSDFIFKRGS